MISINKPIFARWLSPCALLLLSSSLVPLASNAHHGRGEFFDQPSGEMEGEVVEIRWRNPHVTITVRGPAADGSEVLWVLEGSDAGTLARRGLTDGHLKVGDRIKAAGSISSRREHWLATSHILLPSGTELVFGRTGTPRWSSEFIWLDYDGLRDDPVLDCAIPGMPRVMTVVGSRPIEFEQQGDDILLHSENFNQTRLIHMGGEAVSDDVEPSLLGYSRGRWEGNTLVVTTTRVNWPFFDLPPLIGIPQSEDVEIVERFTHSGNELVYDFWAHDPRNFTEPIEVSGYMVWTWHPGLSRRVDACEDYVDVP